MSNRSRHHRRRRGWPSRTSRTDITAAAALSAAIRGCTCRPDLTIRHTPNGPHVHVAHDTSCPAADTGTAIAVIPRSHP